MALLDVLGESLEACASPGGGDDSAAALSGGGPGTEGPGADIITEAACDDFSYLFEDGDGAADAPGRPAHRGKSFSEDVLNARAQFKQRLEVSSEARRKARWVQHGSRADTEGALRLYDDDESRPSTDTCSGLSAMSGLSGADVEALARGAAADGRALARRQDRSSGERSTAAASGASTPRSEAGPVAGRSNQAPFGAAPMGSKPLAPSSVRNFRSRMHQRQFATEGSLPVIPDDDDDDAGASKMDSRGKAGSPWQRIGQKLFSSEPLRSAAAARRSGTTAAGDGLDTSGISAKSGSSARPTAKAASARLAGDAFCSEPVRGVLRSGTKADEYVVIQLDRRGDVDAAGTHVACGPTCATPQDRDRRRAKSSGPSGVRGPPARGAYDDGDDGQTSKTEGVRGLLFAKRALLSKARQYTTRRQFTT